MTQTMKHRRGLTLLELIVVLTILVALAGVLVPLLPGMLGRAHISTGATNIAEVLKAMEMFSITHSAYPDGLDSLVDGNDLYSKLPGFTAGAACGGDIVLASAALTAAEQERLTGAGLVSIYEMATTTTDATFLPYSADPPLAIDLSSEKVALLSAAATTRLNLSGSKHVVLGLGAKSQLIGRGGVASAPVHFGDEANSSPADVYSRFAVVFDVSSGEKAQLVAVVGLHGGSVASLEEHLSEWHSLK